MLVTLLSVGNGRPLTTMERAASVGMVASCFGSAALAVASLATPSWIVSNFAGKKGHDTDKVYHYLQA